MDQDGAAWNVVRSEFDSILLDHAASLGAGVYENTKVLSLEFDENDRPVSAAYSRRLVSDVGNVLEGKITFEYLVDATGRAGLMSMKYLKNRNFTESLKNVALWGYWEGVGTYGKGTTRAGAPWFEALTGTDFHSRTCHVDSGRLFRRIWVGVVHTSAYGGNLRRSCCQQRDLYSSCKSAVRPACERHAVGEWGL